MKALTSLLIIVLVAVLLAACGGAQATPTPVPAPTSPPEPTAPPQPAVGGKMVIALATEPTSLDVHRASDLYPVMQFVGASLLTKDPDSGEYLPYLATEWSVAEDGLSYEFKLRDDVKFHDGTPLTAQDYAYTFNRAIAQQPPSTAGAVLLGLAQAEAVDDHTLKLTMAQPNSTLLDVLSRPTYHQPLPQAATEKLGDDFGRQPISVGPFKFKEWVTGEKIVLERNPDFAWGPSFSRGAAPYIETIEFRFLPEYATRLAGLEAGEVDYMMLEAKDIERLGADGKYQMLPRLDQGSGETILMNVTKAPFDDVNVRKAINLAIDREVLVKVVQQGQAQVDKGPITAATYGYWPGVEQIGYGYDLEQAKKLMTDAGYTASADGILQKDGKPLSLTLMTSARNAKDAEIIQQQLRQLGIDVKIQQAEYGIMQADLTKGNYDFALNRLGWQDYGLMFAMYHPAMLGVFNQTQLNDEALNNLLLPMIGAPVPAVVQDFANKSQQYLVEQAYSAPLYGVMTTYALDNRIHDARFAPLFDAIWLFDAYIDTK
ncbi:MAG: hypothetical protein K1X65_17905 [Caldilineales bacterium]|nr:hypothetical protein [Caldilineales bacterium]MCW5857250.1 hypothetical protein [Caldilineales bacterium]